MILDNNLIFSGAYNAEGKRTPQDVAAAPGATTGALSTNVLDLHLSDLPARGTDGISGQDIWLEVRVGTAANAADAAKTLTIEILSAATSNMNSPASHLSSRAIPGSACTAGTVVWRVKLPDADYARYMALRYTLSSSFVSLGLNACLVSSPDANRHYASNFQVR